MGAPPPEIPDAAWEWLDGLGFEEIIPSAWPSVPDVPHCARDHFTECMQVAMRRMLSSPESAGGLKLFLLVPQLLLRRLPSGERGLQRTIITRCKAFLRGEWEELCVGVGSPQPDRVLAEVTPRAGG